MQGWYLTPCQAGSHSSPAEQEENIPELSLQPSWSCRAGPTSKHHIPGTGSAPQQCPCFQGLPQHDITPLCVCQPCKNLFCPFRVDVGPKIHFLMANLLRTPSTIAMTPVATGAWWSSFSNICSAWGCSEHPAQPSSHRMSLIMISLGKASRGSQPPPAPYTCEPNGHQGTAVALGRAPCCWLWGGWEPADRTWRAKVPPGAAQG